MVTFKRLNTGGALLSEQEVRNCTIRLLDNMFNQFIIDCSQEGDFLECTSSVGSEQIDKKFDQELVLRFFAFKNWADKYTHEIGSFLTEYMEGVTDTQKGVVFRWYASKTAACTVRDWGCQVNEGGPREGLRGECLGREVASPWMVRC